MKIPRIYGGLVELLALKVLSCNGGATTSAKNALGYLRFGFDVSKLTIHKLCVAIVNT